MSTRTGKRGELGYGFGIDRIGEEYPELQERARYWIELLLPAGESATIGLASMPFAP